MKTVELTEKVILIRHSGLVSGALMTLGLSIIGIVCQKEETCMKSWF